MADQKSYEDLVRLNNEVLELSEEEDRLEEITRELRHRTEEAEGEVAEVRRNRKQTTSRRDALSEELGVTPKQALEAVLRGRTTPTTPQPQEPKTVVVSGGHTPIPMAEDKQYRHFNVLLMPPDMNVADRARDLELICIDKIRTRLEGTDISSRVRGAFLSEDSLLLHVALLYGGVPKSLHIKILENYYVYRNRYQPDASMIKRTKISGIIGSLLVGEDAPLRLGRKSINFLRTKDLESPEIEEARRQYYTAKSLAREVTKKLGVVVNERHFGDLIGHLGLKDPDNEHVLNWDARHTLIHPMIQWEEVEDPDTGRLVRVATKRYRDLVDSNNKPLNVVRRRTLYRAGEFSDHLIAEAIKSYKERSVRADLRVVNGGRS